MACEARELSGGQAEDANSLSQGLAACPLEGPAESDSRIRPFSVRQDAHGGCGRGVISAECPGEATREVRHQLGDAENGLPACARERYTGFAWEPTKPPERLHA